jgi:hypothetical protein
MATTALAGALVVAGCAPGPTRDDRAGIPLAGLTTTTPPPELDPPTPQELEAQLLDAYRHNWGALLTAYSESTVVGLHRVSSGPVLYGISDDILYGVRHSVVFDGVATHHPRVETMEDEVAVVLDCMRLDDEVRDSLTGEILDSAQTWHDLRVTLVNEEGVWKIFDFEYVADHCEPPDPAI